MHTCAHEPPPIDTHPCECGIGHNHTSSDYIAYCVEQDIAPLRRDFT